MKKPVQVLLMFALAGCVAATGVYAAEDRDSLQVNIIVGNEHMNNVETSEPFIISIPIKTAGASGYVAALKNGDGSYTVQPFSAYINGAVSVVARQTGAYDVINNTKSFSDIAGHPAETDIAFTSAREIFNGDGAGRFNPDAPMTRAMFTQLIANLEKADTAAYNAARFKDVPATAWYSPAVEWAAREGLASGTGADTFSPEAYITREQMAGMVMNYLTYKGVTLPAQPAAPFDDEAGISAWAGESVTILHRAGVIGADSGNLFNPQAAATRADAATVFARLITAYVGAMS